MITLKCDRDYLDQIEYKECSDDLWYYVGGFRKKMIEWTGTPTRNKNFNNKLYELINNNNAKILELGCGTGLFIQDCLEDGYMAVGLDGNIYYKELSLQAWGKAASNLFVCDIGKPFQLYEDNEELKFDIITTWECLEHLYEPDIEQVLSNIEKHSKKDTYLIYSASQREHLPHHQCVHNQDWWTKKFNSIGFKTIDINFGDHVLRNEHDSIIGYMQK